LRANARSTFSVVIRGLDPRIHLLKGISRSGWIAGSSPAMTATSVRMSVPSPVRRTHKHSFAISPQVLREVWPARSALSNQRARRMPGARCTRSLVCARVVSMHTSIHSESPESSGIPRAMVYGLYRALPGDRLSCHRRCADQSTNLTPASRRQDHTSSPSALASPVKRAVASTAPRPDVRDVRETPL
jgi:hypothetical protein